MLGARAHGVWAGFVQPEAGTGRELWTKRRDLIAILSCLKGELYKTLKLFLGTHSERVKIAARENLICCKKRDFCQGSEHWYSSPREAVGSASTEVHKTQRDMALRNPIDFWTWLCFQKGLDQMIDWRPFDLSYSFILWQDILSLNWYDLEIPPRVRLSAWYLNKLHQKVLRNQSLNYIRMQT